MDIDFHMHSNASDGALSPRDLLALASENGVSRLAITDHDTLDAYKSLDCPDTIELISGIEFSALWNGRTIHIVGLNFDRSSPELQAGVLRQTTARIDRARRIAERMERLGLDDPFNAAMQASNGSPGRPHFARLLVEAGIVKDVATAFRKHLGAGKPGDVKSNWADIQEIVGWIRAAGGSAVIAHPAKYKMTNTKLACLVADFQQAGGQGVEVICGPQDQQVTAKLTRLCEETGMLASCGSDFHTPENRWSSPGRFAPLPKQLTSVWSTW